MPSNACLHLLVYTSLCTSSTDYSLSFTENLDSPAHQLPFHYRTLSWVGSTSTCMNTQLPVSSIPPQPTSPSLVFVSSHSFWSRPPHFWDHQEELHFYLFYHKVTLTTKSKNRMLPPQNPQLARYPEITTIPTSAITDFEDSLCQVKKVPFYFYLHHEHVQFYQMVFSMRWS